MISTARQILLAVTVLVSCVGCNRDEPSPVARPAVPAGKGVVSGTVRFEGEPKPPRRIEEADAAKCHPGAKPIYDDSLVVDAGGGMRNVVVSVLDGPNVAGASPKAVLDQASCQYVPHVLAVRAGEPLTLRSSDPIQHNVHASRAGKNKSFSLPFTAAGQEQTVTLPHAEASPPIEVRCDVHQWMRAYVAVFDHPFFAVTGEGGAFTLAGLPAGTYTVVAWHERFGEKRQQVTVGDGPASPIEFRFGK
jgi:plastocyanin